MTATALPIRTKSIRFAKIAIRPLVLAFRLLMRPPAVIAIITFLVIGIETGTTQVDIVQSTICVAVLLLWFANAAAINDISDEKIDQINLRNGRGRPLVSGVANLNEVKIVALTTAFAAVLLASLLSPAVVITVFAGLTLNVFYSVEPIRLAKRGLIATLILPAGYVAIPMLVGMFAFNAELNKQTVSLFAAIYLIFCGRILLKDFRDEAGDAQHGKNTFVVRHGAGKTCQLSAAFWVSGSVVALFAFPPQFNLIFAFSVCLSGALIALWRMAHHENFVRRQIQIAQVAISGSAMAVLALTEILLIHMSASAWKSGMVLMLTLGLFVLMYLEMVSDESTVTEIKPY